MMNFLYHHSVRKMKEITAFFWPEHNNLTKDSEPVSYLNKHINHVFTWSILCHVSKKTVISKNLEAIFIALLKPSLNEQKNFEHLIHFVNGKT